MHPATRAILGMLSMLASAGAPCATIDVSVRNNFYQPNEITINVGDTVRWTNNSGFHDVVADDNSFSNEAGSGWVYSRTFATAGDVRYFCSVHSVAGVNINAGMNGLIHVNQVAPPPFTINTGIAGSWYNPPTSGQGFLLDVRASDRFMFVAWFTYEVAPAVAAKLGAPEQRWLVAQGTYNGATAQLPMFSVAGGRFNDPTAVSATQVGTLTLNFSSCTAGTATYAFSNGGATGTIPIERLLPGTEALCLSQSAQEAGAE